MISFYFYCRFYEIQPRKKLWTFEFRKHESLLDKEYARWGSFIPNAVVKWRFCCCCHCFNCSSSCGVLTMIARRIKIISTVKWKSWRRRRKKHLRWTDSSGWIFRSSCSSYYIQTLNVGFNNWCILTKSRVHNHENKFQTHSYP